MPLSHGQPGQIEMILKVQTWPREEMRGLPFCQAVEECSEVANSEPELVR